MLDRLCQSEREIGAAAQKRDVIVPSMCVSVCVCVCVCVRAFDSHQATQSHIRHGTMILELCHLLICAYCAYVCVLRCGFEWRNVCVIAATIRANLCVINSAVVGRACVSVCVCAIMCATRQQFPYYNKVFPICDRCDHMIANTMHVCWTRVSVARALAYIYIQFSNAPTNVDGGRRTPSPVRCARAQSPAWLCRRFGHGSVGIDVCPAACADRHDSRLCERAVRIELQTVRVAVVAIAGW